MERIDERGSRAPFYFSFAPPAHSLEWRNKNQKLTKKRNQEGRRRNFLASNSVTSVLSKSSRGNRVSIVEKRIPYFQRDLTQLTVAVTRE